jgi:thiol-disulfide isomerase/thioredoxin
VKQVLFNILSRGLWKVFDRKASIVEEINPSRRRFLGTAALTIGAVRFGMIASAKARSGERGELAALVGATTWLNSQPLTAAELDTKVVMVDFLTYSCINCRRQLPYVRGIGRKVQGSRIGGDRRTRVRVLVREKR